MSTRAYAVGFVLLGALAATPACSCKKAAPTPPEDTTDLPVSTVDDPDRDAAPTFAPARCKAAAEASIDAQGGDLEIGEAVATKDGFAIGVIRTTNDGRIGSVAIVPSDLSKVTLVDLAPPDGDAPPPRPFARGDDLFAAFYDRPLKDRKTNDLHVFRLAPAGAGDTIDAAKARATSALAIEEEKDGTLTFDISAGEKGFIVTWDEDAIGLSNGQVMVVTVSQNGKTLTADAPRIASPTGTDAELPRIVARHGGYWLVWGAKKPEQPVDTRGDGSIVLEGPGEEREFHWLEAIALDEKGAPRSISRWSPAAKCSTSSRATTINRTTEPAARSSASPCAARQRRPTRRSRSSEATSAKQRPISSSRTETHRQRGSRSPTHKITSARSRSTTLARHSAHRASKTPSTKPAPSSSQPTRRCSQRSPSSRTPSSA
jgi:hypothetical protein